MLGKIVFVALSILFSAKPSFATPPVILSCPENLKVDTEFTLTASMSGLTKNGAYRLRIALSKPDSHVYFGSIEDQGIFSKYKNISMDDKGSWKGDIKGKVENSDPNYKDKDLKVFELKLGRYTENGTSATWSEIAIINLENPNPPTSSPAPTQKIQSTPQKTPEPTIIPKTTPIPTEIINDKEINIEDEDILATSTSIIIVSPKPSNAPVIKSNSIAKPFLFVGFLFFLFASALAFIKRKKDN